VIDDLQLRQVEIANRVLRRINDFYPGPPPAQLKVTPEEYAACELIVLAQIEARGFPPFPFTRTGRGILFKDVELYTE